MFWTLGYDTIYGHQDKEDDALVGIKSTALKLGNKSKIWIAGFYALTILCLIVSGFLVDQSMIYYTVLLAIIGHFTWQVWTVNLDIPISCLRKFRSNTLLGAIIFLAIILGKIL
jgi:4-hydroxybenzoate polyprenyltransferase